MRSTARPLIIVEEGLFFASFPKHARTPIKPEGHWFEQIEAFATAWPGDVVLIRPEGEMRQLAGVLRQVPVTLKPFPLSQRVKRWATTIGHRLAMRFGALGLGSYFFRLSVEAMGQTHTALAIADQLNAFPDAVVLAPTASVSLCESIARHSGVFKRPGVPPVPILFLWHESRFSNPFASNTLFGQQLQRWTERATGAQLIHRTFMEANADRWSTPAHHVNWLPWPLTQYEQNIGAGAHISNRAPLVFVYAARTEQGSDDIPSIVRSLQEAYRGRFRYRVLSGKLAAEQLRAEIAAGSIDSSPDSGLAIADITRKVKDLSAFQASLDDVAVAVLPYVVSQYVGRGSAALANMLIRGIPVVVPAGTGPGDLVNREGVGETYTHQREIAERVDAVIAEREKYTSAISAHLQRHRAATEAFIRMANET